MQVEWEGNVGMDDFISSFSEAQTSLGPRFQISASFFVALTFLHKDPIVLAKGGRLSAMEGVVLRRPDPCLEASRRAVS